MVVVLQKDGILIPESFMGDGTIRILFKIYFSILIMAVAAFGSLVCRYRVRHDLLRGVRVPLTATIGWMHGPSLAKVAFFMRGLPCGWLGILMLAATTFDLLGEYGVAKQVTKTQKLSTATTDTGLIVDAKQAVQIVSSPDWEAARLAGLGQQWSYTNANASHLAMSGYGIYRFIAYDYRFLANDNDILGYWNCNSTTTTPILYDASQKGTQDELYDTMIAEDLQERGLLYQGTPYSLNVSHIGGPSRGPATHTSFISVNDTVKGNPWGVKAAFDFLDVDSVGSKEMVAYECEVTATLADTDGVIDRILRGIDNQQTGLAWGRVISAAMYPGLYDRRSYSQEQIRVTLEYYLNSLIMVAGSSERTTTPNVDNYTYGIVEMPTMIPYWIMLVCVAMILLALFMMSYMSYLYLAVRFHRQSYDQLDRDEQEVSGQEIHDNTPVGLLEWISHATYSYCDTEQPPQHHHLYQWALSTRWQGGRRLGIKSGYENREAGLGDSIDVRPLKSQNRQAQTTLLPGLSTESKKQYMIVRAREL